MGLKKPYSIITEEGEGCAVIICCGEALMDMLPEPSDGEVMSVFVPFRAARYSTPPLPSGVWERMSAFLPVFLQDSFGRQLRAHLRASHVDFTLCPDQDENTTLAFVMIEQGQASYRFYDDNSAGRMLRSSDLPNLPDRGFRHFTLVG